MDVQDREHTTQEDEADLTIHVGGRQQVPDGNDKSTSSEPAASSANGPTSETSEPPSKRRRVALACSVCRARKSRVSYELELIFV